MTCPLDKRRLEQFLKELRPLLKEWDPMGVFSFDPAWPDDEYDCVSGLVARCTVEPVPEMEAVSRLRAEVREHMGVEADIASTTLLLRSAAALWERLGAQS